MLSAILSGVSNADVQADGGVNLAQSFAGNALFHEGLVDDAPLTPAADYADVGAVYLFALPQDVAFLDVVPCDDGDVGGWRKGKFVERV